MAIVHDVRRGSERETAATVVVFVLVMLAALPAPSQATVDRTKSLILAMTTQTPSDSSAVFSLIGNPVAYVDIGNGSLSDFIDDSVRTSYGSYGFFDSIDVYIDAQKLYYGDNAFHELGYGPLIYNTGAEETEFVNIGSTLSISAVSLDWVTKNLYWSTGRSIKVTRFSGRITKTIVSENLTDVRDLAVNLVDAYLFWCQSSAIERSDLAGGGRVVLLNSVQATDLKIDFSARRLYYLQTNGLGSMAFDGSKRQTWTLPETFVSLAIQQNVLLLASSFNVTVDLYKIKNESTIAYSYSLFYNNLAYKLTDIAMFSIEAQPIVAGAPCGNGGGCSQFCFATSNQSMVCGCDDAKSLDADGNRCVGPSVTEGQTTTTIPTTTIAQRSTTNTGITCAAPMTSTILAAAAGALGLLSALRRN